MWNQLGKTIEKKAQNSKFLLYWQTPLTDFWTDVPVRSLSAGRLTQPLHKKFSWSQFDKKLIKVVRLTYTSETLKSILTERTNYKLPNQGFAVPRSVFPLVFQIPPHNGTPQDKLAKYLCVTFQKVKVAWYSDFLDTIIGSLIMIINQALPFNL